MAGTSNGDVYSAAEAQGLRPEEILDFSANVNSAPLAAASGSAEALRQALQDAPQSLMNPPDPQARKLRRRAAEVYGVAPDEVLVGNGVNEFLYAIPRGLRPRRVVMPAPCCTDYWRASDYAGAESEGVLCAEAKEFILEPAQIEMHLGGTDLLFLGNPADPTGVAMPAETIRGLARKFSSVVFVVDEGTRAYIESMGYDIVGDFGDQYSDLTGGYADRTFKMPNPNYFLP